MSLEECSLCGFAGFSRDDLERHVQQEHPETRKRKSGPGPGSGTPEVGSLDPARGDVDLNLENPASHDKGSESAMKGKLLASIRLVDFHTTNIIAIK